MDDGRHMIDLQNESSRRWITAVLVGAALLSAAYWAEVMLLRFREGMPEASLRAASAKPPVTQAEVLAAPSADALTELLGAQPKTQAATRGPAERFKVMGVIATASGQGTALVAVDGQPARAYRVGAELAPGFVLRSVSQKELTLAASPEGEVLATLPLPEPSSAGGTAAGTGASSPGASNPAGATDGPPNVSSSRGNPRSVEPIIPQAPPAPSVSGPPGQNSGQSSGALTPATKP